MTTKTQQRKEREREARRDAILDAASQVFAHRGYYEATLSEIADAAELGKGTLYNYYKDKEDIFISLARRSLDEFERELESSRQTAADLRDYIRRTFNLLVESMLKHGYLLRTMLQHGVGTSGLGGTNAQGVCRGEQDTVEAHIAKSLAQFSELRDQSAQSCTAAAIIILGTARHIALTGWYEQRPTPTEEDMARIVTIVTRALT